MPRHVPGVGLVIAALVGVLAGCSSSSGSLPTTPQALPCSPKPTGALCLKVLGHGLTVQDAIGYLVASDSPLAGKTWRLVLSSYSCDPGDAAKPDCAATDDFPADARQGTPPVERFCRHDGVVDSKSPGCHTTLAEALASRGDWHGFGLSKPKTFPRPVWLCVSEQVRTHGKWAAPDASIATSPVRACAAVKG